jgi:tRNA(Ile)-lysidine synthase
MAGMTTDTASPSRHRFLEDLASALPTPGLWAMPFIVGVSGGADSVALLRGLERLVPPAARRRLIVAHAEHDLRSEASDDRAFVAQLAERLGVEVACRRIAVRTPDGHRDGLEARARRRRYDFFRAVARDHGGRYVLVAHTADDQAETILHRALRGTGLTGLAGMRPARQLTAGVSLLRPMLGVTRADARGFLADIGQAWREDPTNADVRHARNFLRHRVLRECEAGPYPAAAAALVRLGQLAAGTAAAFDAATSQLLAGNSHRHRDGGVLLRTNELALLPRQLRAELVVALWRREAWPQQDMTRGHYDRLADLIADCSLEPDTARAIDLPGGVRASPEPAGLLITPPPGHAGI